MAAGHNDPRLLYSVPNILAYHIQNGKESPIALLVLKLSRY